MLLDRLTLGRQIEGAFALLLLLTAVLGLGAAAGVDLDGGQAAGRLRAGILAATIAVVAVGGVLAFFTARRVGGILARVADDIEANAVRVATAAGTIRSVSSALAASAVAQSATVQETAASLEQIGAMSQQTSELTAGSEALMNENIERSGQSLKALMELTRAMEEIEQDADAIRAIINTIDSIAFQTNLLALNAAVEAARAGEAGAGFAVVAAEVKGLANRTADAAKNTGELLDKTIQRIIESAEALKRVNADFDRIVNSATGIGEKNAAITQATHEQAQGIEEITRASVAMEKATRDVSQNAVRASEAAAELSAEAEQMGVMVTHLVSLVHGKKRELAQIEVPTADVTCWEMKNCPPDRRNSCPAYPDQGNQCWVVTGTLCGGQEQGSYREKMANCRKCDVYKAAHQGGAIPVDATPEGRPAVVCWEMKNCPPDRRDSCPAYPNDGGNCWMVTGTLCGGQEQGSYREKMANCRKCDVYKAAHDASVSLPAVVAS